MANKAGWWELHTENVEDDENFVVSDNDLEHIAQLIREGYTSGEIVKDEEDWPGQNNGISAMAGDNYKSPSE